MELNQDTVDTISQIKDEDEAFDKVLKILEIFMQKYNEFKENKEMDQEIFLNYKKDTKIVFTILYNFFDNVNMDEEDSDYEEDKENFDLLKSNIMIVINNIDEIESYNSLSKNELLNYAIKYVLNYFEKGKDNMEELNKVMSSGIDMLNNSLDKINNTFKIKEILNDVNKDDVSKEYLIENNKWCKEYLRDNFKKEDVMVVIEKIQKFDTTDYKELFEKEEDNEIKNRYIQYIQIENVLNTILLIESKIKKIEK